MTKPEGAGAVSRAPARSMTGYVARLLLSSVVTSGLTMLSGIVVARFLGADERGGLAVALVVAQFLAGTGALGHDAVLGRDAGLRRTAKPELLARLLFLSLTLGAFNIGIGWLALPLVLGEATRIAAEAAYLALAVVPPGIAVTLLVPYSLGEGDLRIYNWARVGYALIYVALLLLCVAVGSHDVRLYAGAFVVAGWLAAIAGFVVAVRSTGSRAVLRASWRQAARTCAHRTPAAARFATAIYLLALEQRLAVLLLSALADLRAVGLYVVAYTAASAHLILAQAVGRSLFVTILQDEASSRSGVTAGQLRRWIVVYAGLTVVMMAVLPTLVPLVFGPSYAGTALLLLLLVPASSMASIGAIIEEANKAHGLGGANVRARAGGVAVLAAAGTVGSATLGADGMAAAQLAAAAAQAVLFARYGREALGLDRVRDIVPRIVDLRAVTITVASLPHRLAGLRRSAEPAS